MVATSFFGFIHIKCRNFKCKKLCKMRRRNVNLNSTQNSSKIKEIFMKNLSFWRDMFLVGVLR
jgi:hypothetical protein